MSSAVPPQIIQVKRKRNDDGPVTFLRIEQSTKRHRTGAFLYQRHDPEAAVDSPAAAAAAARQHAAPPVIRASRPGDENLPLEKVKRNHAAAAAGHGSAAAGAAADAQSRRGNAPAPSASAPGRQQPTIPQAPQPAAKAVIEPRRFHLSRSNSHNAVEPHSPLKPGSRGGKVPQPAAAITATAKGSAPALFVERTKRKHTSLRRKAAEAAARAASRSPRPTSAQSQHDSRSDKEQSAHSRADGDADLSGSASDTLHAPKPRLPLQRRRGGGSAGSSTPKLPDSLVNRWDTDMDKLAREMNEYTLQHIARDLEKIQERDAATAPKQAVAAASDAAKGSSKERKASSNSPMKFKPHPPAKRYPERHPQPAKPAVAHRGIAAENSNGNEDGMDVDMDVDREVTSDSEDDDADYVIDTYVRVTADSVRAQATPDKVGLLVLDNEPDLESFYGQESDSEDELEDEDDENAENYYAADYPDDEVATDDEFDRNPYLYRTGNASDLEEFDDASESEDNDEGDDRFKITIGKPQNLPGLY
ncbi:hypothetical protein RB595_005607 [Gaeumannomyces hyphopodioides]